MRGIWNILDKGVGDGCALGTTGMKDWTLDGIHLCNVRLRLLRMNTMPAFDPTLVADVSELKKQKSAQLRNLGRLPYPMIRQQGEKGFRRVSWDEALGVISDRAVGINLNQVSFFQLEISNSISINLHEGYCKDEHLCGSYKLTSIKVEQKQPSLA